MKRLNLNGEWKFSQISHSDIKTSYSDIVANQNEWFSASVPGDVHNDLLAEGKIENPYYSDNTLRCGFVTENDWCYKKEFWLEENEIQANSFLEFDGIDTFADLFFNGAFIGKTDNMFLKYSFHVSKLVKSGKNEIVVILKSIKEAMKNLPQEGYFGCFNVQRIFVRKAQCHFSWDWAPNFPATGIWEPVRFVTYQNTKISNVSIKTKCSGDISFCLTLDKETYENCHHVKKEVKVIIDDNFKQYTIQKSLANFKNNFSVFIEQPHLWWPADLGEPFLYSYKIEYYENDILVDVLEGKFGIREIQYKEKPKKTEIGITSEIYVNGVPVFLKGANWVPLDIMTGRIKDEKYLQSITLAKEANCNCLRVWGGGIYEKDIFYNLCDQMGIMVWQDFAFACSDIPDDNPEFVEKVIPEIEYQLVRLRNHPSIILWSGGNEKTGSIGKNKSRGDRLVYYTIRGITMHMDGTRPYFPSSPWGYSDDSNSQDSGDSHCNSYQAAMTSVGVEKFRETLAGFTAPMASEIAVQGCSSVKFLKTFLPEDKLWPINEIWDLHLTRNPYDGTDTTFAQQQQMAVQKILGDFNSLEEYVTKSMTVHSEFVKSDIEYHRTRKGNCSGAMLWMYSDVWPCGTWATVDYDLTPKAAYYSLKRTNKPILPAIIQTKNGIKAYVVNDTRKEFFASVKVGQMNINGKILFERVLENCRIEAIKSNGLFAFDGYIKQNANSFLFIEMMYDNHVVKNVFFHKLWADIKWENPNIEYKIISNRLSDKNYEMELEITCDNYARMVNIDFDNLNEAIISDNYFDMLPNETKYIKIKSNNPVNTGSIKLYDWINYR